MLFRSKEAEGRAQKLINGFYFSHGWSVPVALSPEVQKSIAAFYGLPLEKIPIIYNGIDLSRCLEKQDYALQNPAILTHIGRFNEQKNHEGLLHAFALIHKKHPLTRLNLLGDGELLEQTQALAKTLGLSDSVDFLGSQSNVYPYLQNSDLFLLPSRYEGMPMTLIEAMGTGLPIVASKVGGVPDMLEDGKSAILTDCNPEKVAQAACRILEDEALRKTLGRAAKAGSETFSAAHMAESYVRVYRAEGA